MDFIALTNMTGLAKAGNPQNQRYRKINRPLDRQAEIMDMYDGIELSASINMKSPVFADVMRQAYERRASARG